MKSLISVAAVTLLTGSTLAQGQMPLPSYTNTFAATAATHGYWLQAPVDFEVTGLRVPDEKRAGKQNVALYVTKTISTSATTLTPNFFSAGTSSSTQIPCSVKVQKGEYLVVLGSCDDGSTQAVQNNSFGVGGFKTNILGQLATLVRVWTNTDIVALKGGGAFTPDAPTSTTSIGRVQLFIKGQKKLPPIASAENFGAASANKKIGSPFMPLADFSRTYTWLSQVRGYHFQAPTDFDVIGFNVPNEANAKEQVVAFYVFPMKPSSPARPTAAELKFFTPAPVKSDTVLKPKAPIQVKKGEYVCVFGTCWNGTYLNSYSAGDMNMSVLGQKFTATRLTTNNLIGRGGLGALQLETRGPCARVEIHVAGQSGFPPFYVPEMTTTELPLLGKTAKLEMKANLPAQLGVIFGSTARLASPAPTPFGNLLIDPGFWGSFVIPTGSGELALPLPMDTSLNGVKVPWQGLSLELSQTIFGMTNGVEWSIGERLP